MERKIIVSILEDGDEILAEKPGVLGCSILVRDEFGALFLIETRGGDFPLEWERRKLKDSLCAYEFMVRAGFSEAANKEFPEHAGKSIRVRSSFWELCDGEFEEFQSVGEAAENQAEKEDFVSEAAEEEFLSFQRKLDEKEVSFKKALKEAEWMRRFVNKVRNAWAVEGTKFSACASYRDRSPEGYPEMIVGSCLFSVRESGRVLIRPIASVPRWANKESAVREAIKKATWNRNEDKILKNMEALKDASEDPPVEYPQHDFDDFEFRYH